jgi:hypothetical protein
VQLRLPRLGERGFFASCETLQVLVNILGAIQLELTSSIDLSPGCQSLPHELLHLLVPLHLDVIVARPPSCGLPRQVAEVRQLTDGLGDRSHGESRRTIQQRAGQLGRVDGQQRLQERRRQDRTTQQYNAVANMRAAGTQVEWHTYAGLSRNGAVNASLQDSLPFVQRLLAGEAIAGTRAKVVPSGPPEPAAAGVPFND